MFGLLPILVTHSVWFLLSSLEQGIFFLKEATFSGHKIADRVRVFGSGTRTPPNFTESITREVFCMHKGNYGNTEI